MKILLVEEQDAVAEPLTAGLRREGFSVERAVTAGSALEAGEADLVLIDLGLADLDGAIVCRSLRERIDAPIIVVSDRTSPDVGADDYVIRPFGIRELVARIRAVMRRTSTNGHGSPMSVDGLEVDERSRRAVLDGVELGLTPKEFDILAALVRDPGAVLSRRRLLEEVWQTTWYGSAKTIDVHVGALRRKLGDPGWIETVRGVGFRLRSP